MLRIDWTFENCYKHVIYGGAEQDEHLSALRNSGFQRRFHRKYWLVDAFGWGYNDGLSERRPVLAHSAQGFRIDSFEDDGNSHSESWIG